MDLFRTAELFNGISGIPTAILGTDGVEAEYCVRHFHPSPAQFFVSPILNESTDQAVDVTMSEEQVICGFVVDLRSSRALLLGPVMEHPCTRRTALRILKRMDLSYKRADELLHYLEKIPCIALTVFISNLYFLNYVINDQLPPEENWYRKLAAQVASEHMPAAESEQLSHNPRSWDRVLESCIEYGKIEELDRFMSHIRSEGKMGITAEDSLRSFKNVAISSVALISRAAARGGMEYEAALSLSDEYIRRLESQNSFEEVNQVLVESFYKYTSIVSEIRSLNSRSALVHSVAAYVKRHLSEPVQVADLAEELGYNDSYLCRRFKKETGKTVKEYINEVKLEEAQYLLRSTDKPVVDVAMELGYSSAAYFSTLFKSHTGITPQAFREKAV